MRPSPQRIVDFREYPILYVDDEIENLRIFELTFRRDFQVVTARDAEEGLRILNAQPIAIVLSDHRMPGMTGNEFLGRVRELDPRTVRILVTAFGDAGTLAGAINDGSIFRYVAKPWQPDEMRMVLRNAVEVFALDRERDELLFELSTLHHVSQAIARQLELEPLIDLVLDTVTDELRFDGAMLMFFDGAGTRLAQPRFSRTGDVAERLHDLELRPPQARDFIETVKAGGSQRLALGQAFDLESPIRSLMTEIAAEELLVVPLVGPERVLGALFVDNRSGGRRFGAAERTLLEGIANQAATAIANARLVESLRRSGEEVVHADRIGQLGSLAVGLAGEIEDPIAGIRDFVARAGPRRLDEDPEFWRDGHARVLAQVERIEELVRHMRELGSRGEPGAPEQCELGHVAEVVERLLAGSARRSGVRVVLERAETAKLGVDREALQQILLHLVRNAIEVTPSGAEVRIRVTGAGASGGPTIEVVDAGPEIPAEDLECLFDPFFRSQRRAGEAGLGLAVCQRLVGALGGGIEVQSGPAGTVFRVVLSEQG